MQATGNTLLITGATSGIGLGLAQRFLQAGNEVIICGRREDRLRDLARRHPGMHVRRCDVANAADRVGLCAWATGEFPRLNVLINNAGIQRRINLPPTEPWEETAAEIEINVNAPIHLSLLFAPHLEQRPNAAIVNVTSGLAFVPLVIAPVYSATKAALHSFTLSLRHALAPRGVEVIEIIPPAVDTDLGGPGLHRGATPLDEFVDSVMAQLAAGALEITHGTSTRSSQASRAELDQVFARMNGTR